MINEPETEIRVLRVAEGQPGRDSDGNPSRIFSVVLSRPAGEDLGIVAAAVDPGRKAEGRRQKAEGEEKKETPGLSEADAEAVNQRYLDALRWRAARRAALDVSAVPEACGLKPEVFPCRIPAPGSPHPTLAGYVARAPLIFSVGLRSKDGAMLAACSNFYNVRVRYAAAAAIDSGQGTMDSEQETGDNAGNRPLSIVNCQLPTATEGSAP